MKRLSVLFALLTLMLAPLAPAHVAWAQGTQFASIVDDLPLMQGLSEAGESVTFETPQGRIAETTATGRASPREVLDFYAETLPQLGWTQADTGTFVRDGERLTIDPQPAAGGAVSVRFKLSPEAAAK